MELLNDCLIVIEYIIEYRFPLQIKCFVSIYIANLFSTMVRAQKKMLTAKHNIIAVAKCIDTIEK